jgi:hypothetical protein
MNTHAMNTRGAFILKGKAIPKIGDVVRVEPYFKHSHHKYAKVHRVNERGVPTKLQLPDGKIIAVVGLILELVGLIERLILAVKCLFSKEAKKERAAIRRAESDTVTISTGEKIPQFKIGDCFKGANSDWVFRISKIHQPPFNKSLDFGYRLLVKYNQDSDYQYFCQISETGLKEHYRKID